jgi:hypothetical protein
LPPPQREKLERVRNDRVRATGTTILHSIAGEKLVFGDPADILKALTIGDADSLFRDDIPQRRRAVTVDYGLVRYENETREFACAISIR